MTEKLFGGVRRQVGEDEIAAFERELQDAIEGFDADLALHVATAVPRAQASAAPSRFPAIDPAAARAARAPAPAALPPAPGRAVAVASGSLLDELRGEADRKLAADARRVRSLQADEVVVDAAMRRIWSFVEEFSRHLETLQAPVAATYPLAPKVDFGGLRWVESFADYRSSGSSENAPMALVSLRYRLEGDAPVTLDLQPGAEERFANELMQLGLRHELLDQRNDRGQATRHVFRIAPAIRVSLLFVARAEERAILLRGRNFGGFGASNFRIDPERVTPEFLDDLGRYVLGRPNHLLGSLRVERS